MRAFTEYRKASCKVIFFVWRNCNLPVCAFSDVLSM